MMPKTPRKPKPKPKESQRNPPPKIKKARLKLGKNQQDIRKLLLTKQPQSLSSRGEDEKPTLSNTLYTIKSKSSIVDSKFKNVKIVKTPKKSDFNTVKLIKFEDNALIAYLKGKVTPARLIMRSEDRKGEVQSRSQEELGTPTSVV